MTADIIPFPQRGQGISLQAITGLQQYALLDPVPHPQVQQWGLEEAAAGAFPLYSFSREPCYYAASLIAQLTKKDPALTAHFASDIPADDIRRISSLGGVRLEDHLAAERFRVLTDHGRITQRNGRVPISELDAILKDYLYAAAGAPRAYHEKPQATIIPLHSAASHQTTRERDSADPRVRRQESSEAPLRIGNYDVTGLFDALYPKMLGYATKLTGNQAEAEDLVASTFEKSLRLRHTYEEKGSIESWFFTIIKNLFIDRYHRNRREATDYHDSLEPLERALASTSRFDEGDADPFQAVDQDGLAERIQQAIDTVVTPENREVLRLRHFEDCSYQEISSRLEIPLGTVMSRLYRGRQQLVDHLDQEGRMTTPGLPVTPSSEEEKIIADYSPGSAPAASQEQIRDALPLVRKVAYQLARRVPSHVSVDDLISAGHEGLMESAVRYDGKRDFRRYAEFRIKGAMQDYLRQIDPLGRDTRNRATKVKRLEHGLNGEAAREVIMQEAGITERQYDDMRQQLQRAHTISLDRLAAQGTEVSGGNHAPPTPEDLYAARQQQEFLEKAISRIPENEKGTRQHCLRLYLFGDRNMRQIGEGLGFTESRAHQIIGEALAELQTILRRQGIVT